MQLQNSTNAWNLVDFDKHISSMFSGKHVDRDVEGRFFIVSFTMERVCKINGQQTMGTNTCEISLRPEKSFRNNFVNIL